MMKASHQISLGLHAAQMSKGRKPILYCSLEWETSQTKRIPECVLAETHKKTFVYPIYNSRHFTTKYIIVPYLYHSLPYTTEFRYDKIVELKTNKLKDNTPNYSKTRKRKRPHKQKTP